MTEFEDILETILEEYARRDSEGEFDTWEETDAFVKEKAEVLLAYAKEEHVSKQNLSNSFNIGKDCKEESVSEELEEAADNALNNVLNTYEIVNVGSCLDMFRFGAKWQKEKDDEEKVLIYKHGFNDCEEHIKEILLSEVLPCFMHGGEADEVVAKLDEVLNQKK